TGTVYQYVQISTQNLADKLATAKVQFKVEKSKVSDKNKVVVSKFDETGKKWNELPTTLSSEDSTSYYYDAEVSSFSYFAISENVAVAGDTGSDTGSSGTTGNAGSSSLTWLWIVIGVVVLALLIWAVVRKK
ncbi:MAG: PGF-pre-PGF domain-containing protein, partial [Nanoarchaeota archaeon]